MTTEGCSSTVCPSEEELRPWRAIAYSAAILVFLIFWFIISWRPVVPEAEWAIARLLAAISASLASCMCFKDTRGDSAETASELTNCLSTLMAPIYWVIKQTKWANAWWQENKGGQLLKTYITFLQILSSFNMFTVQWPTAFTAAINWVRGTVKFDVMRLPVLSCLWNGVSWRTTLHTYSLAPLGLVVALAVPVLAAWLRGLRLNARKRWREAVDRFYRYLLLAFFILYPALSMQTLSVLNCDPNVGRLRDDYRVVCPHLLSFDSLFSYVFMALFPIGIPLAMHLALRYAGIVEVAREKIQTAEFYAMLSLFMKIHTSIEVQSFARLVGNVDGDEAEFQRQCKRQFKLLLARQGDGNTCIDLARLKPAAEDAPDSFVGMHGTTIKGICKYLQEFDADGNGKIDIDKFVIMLQAARTKANLFNGSEDPNSLIDLQAETLLLFDKWPTMHGGPGDTGENEGLGGMLAVIDKDKIAGNTGDQGRDDAERAEKRAQRQLNVDSRGLVTCPELVKIHELEQELQKQKAAGRISSVYLRSDNELSADIKDTKAAYVKNPDQVDACLKRIKIKALPPHELRSSILELAHRLCKDEITAIPAQVWHTSFSSDGEDDDDKDPLKEQQIIARFGFLFIAYRVDCWWFEGVEMLRYLCI
jgi:hypothetical protein